MMTRDLMLKDVVTLNGNVSAKEAVELLFNKLPECISGAGKPSPDRVKLRSGVIGDVKIGCNHSTDITNEVIMR